MAALDVEHAKMETHIRTLKLSGHVGFDSLPDQLVNKSVQNGFVFNILCIGETGLGKSTLMDSLFNTNFESTPSPHNLPTVKLKAHTYELQESNVRLKLTICDTVGYGDQVNKEDSFKAVVDYIDAQFEAYLQEELKIKRSISAYHDSRLHVCLYFICPTGHGLKSIDLVCMKKLDTKVNIIPIIAKADTISKTELQKFKSKIMQELQNNGVEIYQFPTDDESVSDVNSSMNSHIPFAVVGSTDFVKIGNKTVRARQYPWGTVQDKDRNERPIIYEDAEWEEDLSQTQKELTLNLEVTQQAVSQHLKSLGIINKQSNWVPYELKPRHVERRLCMSEMLLARHKKSVLHQFVTGDEKWIHYDNPERRKSWGLPGHASTSTVKPNIHGKKLMLCIWWDQRGVVYYELLSPCETITETLTKHN
ncbi:Septin-2 [Eumeta japonica]|uniref:Septin-2 n=1 Tax=Eumeta variegata TaxID=151549 RepID=A0A4C1WFX9_EUMVA|nr:Septin-2 [Eumeta japonica]